MTTLTEEKRLAYEEALQGLVNAARADGIVLSIETLNLKTWQQRGVPDGCWAPEMGSYALQAVASLAKELYRTPT